MYPLNVKLKDPQVGFAVANDEAEHQALTEAGYLPAYVVPADAAPAAKKTKTVPADAAPAA